MGISFARKANDDKKSQFIYNMKFFSHKDGKIDC
jgi:hypothetical protein